MTRFTPHFLTLLLIPGLMGFFAAAQSQSDLALDRTATFKTIIPHRNAIPAAKPAAEIPGESEALFLGFSGSPYSVGATITPTSTVPEAEEHIAVDPNNFNNLIAIISDFSKTAGFNTNT